MHLKLALRLQLFLNLGENRPRGYSPISFVHISLGSEYRARKKSIRISTHRFFRVQLSKTQKRKNMSLCEKTLIIEIEI